MASLNSSVLSNIDRWSDRRSNPSFTGCAQINGARNVNPFGRLKQVRVSRLATEVADVSELSQADIVVREEASAGEGSNLQNPVLGSEVRKSARSLWRRFRGSKREVKGGEVASSECGTRRIKQEQEKRSKFDYKGNGSDSISVMDKGLEAAVSAIGSDSSVAHCNSILKRLERSSDRMTLSFFEWMRNNGKLKKNGLAYNLVLRVLSRKGEWDSAEKLLREMSTDSECILNFQVFNTLIYACYRRGLTDLATKWFHLMLQNGVQPNIATFGMLMNLYQKGGNVAEAESAFAKMRFFKLHCHSAYSAMITIYTRLGLYDKSEEIIGLMKEDRVIPNLENWLVQLNAYSQQGKLEKSEQVLRSMQEVGFSPNIVAYNTLITGYGKVSNMDGAQRLFQNLKNVGLEPDETTYRSMIEGWGRADNYREARWYYDELKRSGFEPNSSNLYTMINLQAKHKDEEGAMQTLEDMSRIGCQYSSILSSVLRAYEKVGRIDKIPLILKGKFYEHVLVDQTSCSILVMAYVKCSLVDDALDVLKDKRWKDPNFEDNLYHFLICSCKELGYHENAVKIFTEMPKQEGIPNLHITCTMIDIYGAMGRFADAKNLYLNLESSGTSLDMIAYSVVVRMYAKAGSLNEACLVLDKMEKQKDIVPDNFLFLDMLRIYQKCGMVEKLANLYYKILKSGITWDQEMYNCVINCCARALPVDELSRLFNEMIQRGFSPNVITFNVMLDVFGKAKLFKKVRKVFWMAKKRGLVDVISYNTIIAAYGQSKDFNNMTSTVKKMEFNGFSVSLEAYNCMLDAYGKEGQMESFRSVLQKMRESSCDSDHYTYNTMINIYGEQGWIEEVANVLTELKECGLQPDLCSYNTLIKAYGIAGMVEEAVGVVKEMRENGIEPDQITYVNLINALRKNDNFLEAVKWSLWMKQMRMSNSKC
ncbi:PREDICTED: pentatricopeptide repeat-containing protein At4g30825, chloroplastic [Nelumbo nucifera]|uniref:Pentatricopeptide repeat-containing protein At4g30825, chloroplastic n=2 Tax=Nelumbo nucifera TaxID=4432 RepID=A0A822ZPD2_NELNU|nr:PREDICTED: pentatricopeptide repeat-containing protein At4g30825, chloroplastic [Nelumbo nucifera]DAD45391.1 TPA_asm: hypothetical protein HUJ06_003621 [Nelumbo nucifera]